MSSKPSVKGWKGYSDTFSCRGVHYTLNKTMHLKDADVESGIYHEYDCLVICQHGIHFCTHPLDVLKYYGPHSGNRFSTVVATGVVLPQNEPDSDSKHVTDKLRPLKEVSVTDLVEAAMLDCTYTYKTASSEPEHFMFSDLHDVKILADAGFIGAITGSKRCMLDAGSSYGVYAVCGESSVLTVKTKSVGATYGEANAVVTTDDAAVAASFGVDSVIWVRSHFSVGFAGGAYERVVVSSSMSVAISIDHTTEIELNHDDCMAIAAGPVHVRGRNCVVVFQPFTPEYTRITCDKPTMLVLRKPKSQQLIAIVWSGFNEYIGRIFQDYLEWKKGKECYGPFIDINKDWSE